MDWYCKFCNTPEGRQCPYRSKELSAGAVLATNEGTVGTWYRDEEIDTRPQSLHFWEEVEAYACNCENEKDCPVEQAKQRTIDRWVEQTLQQGGRYAWSIERDMFGYIMTRLNPYRPSYPKHIGLPEELVDDAWHKLRAELDLRGYEFAGIKNNQRQPT